MGIESKADVEKRKPFSLPATDDVVCLINRIRRKYINAEMALDPSDDGPLSRPGDSQILRAGLIRLALSLDVSKPKEVMALIDCAEKRRGPQTDHDNEETHDTQTHTSPRDGTVNAAVTGSS